MKEPILKKIILGEIGLQAVKIFSQAILHYHVFIDKNFKKYITTKSLGMYSKHFHRVMINDKWYKTSSSISSPDHKHTILIDKKTISSGIPIRDIER